MMEENNNYLSISTAQHPQQKSRSYACTCTVFNFELRWGFIDYVIRRLQIRKALLRSTITGTKWPCTSLSTANRPDRDYKVERVGRGFPLSAISTATLPQRQGVVFIRRVDLVSTMIEDIISLYSALQYKSTIHSGCVALPTFKILNYGTPTCERVTNLSRSVAPPPTPFN